MNDKWLQDKQLILLGVIVVISIISLILSFTAGNTSTSTTIDSPIQPVVATAPVSLIIIQDATCSECIDVGPLEQELTQAGVNITENSVLEITEAQKIIDTYGLVRAPTIIISSGIKEYAEINTALASFAREASDGSLIIENYAPYVDIKTRVVRGLTTITYLSDASCEECYDVELHKQVLSRVGMSIKQETFVDVQSAEGKKLIATYQITKIPTILLSSDAKEYPALIQVWPTVGKIDADGTFIFEQTEAMGTYKNLETNEVISK